MTHRNARRGAGLPTWTAVLSALLLTGLSAGLIQAAHAQVAAPTLVVAAPLGPGLHTLEVAHGGMARKVLLYIPARSAAVAAGRAPGQAWPLVLALHGGGGHAAFMADDERYGLRSQADRSGFVVAFPNGYSKWPGGRFATWNAGGCCGDARDRQIDDVGFLRAVVADVQTRVPIDPARVFATGMSNGGMMSHRLACEAADVFRAVASVAGTDATTTCAPSRPVAVLQIHARNDTHVLFNGGAGKEAFRDESKVMDFVSVPATISRWVQRQQCQPVPRRTLERPGPAGAHCEAYSGCKGQQPVALCVTETGGHSWPGASVVRRGKEAASQALDANAQIWAFFAASPVP
ncbi:alpha/beta hydrolase family esterase [Ideonella sp.]|uniref:extracellular catalytic domain type 1 short-chain-length polyhydroxyalkanoate depolymerase n=1 Tax=Ideonella sp. TaxID=1929293 RepID=UPI003BB74C35